MNYNLLILRRAQKALSRLPQNDFNSLCDEIRSLSDNPHPHGSKKLTGRSGWRIRKGDYRIIYKIDDSTKTITVLHIGKRKDVYR